MERERCSQGRNGSGQQHVYARAAWDSASKHTRFVLFAAFYTGGSTWKEERRGPWEAHCRTGVIFTGSTLDSVPNRIYFNGRSTLGCCDVWGWAALELSTSFLERTALPLAHPFSPFALHFLSAVPHPALSEGEGKCNSFRVLSSFIAWLRNSMCASGHMYIYVHARNILPIGI